MSFKAECFVLFILIFLELSTCFNFDTDFPIIYTTPDLNNKRSSYFGYSVILYQGDNSTRTKPWIQIGAPRGNASIYKKINEPGTIYRCNIGEPCNLFPVDKEGKRNSYGYTANGEYRIKKDGAWIGGTQDIDFSSERVVMCGHRWMNILTQRYIQGACYWSETNKNSSESLLPLITREYANYKGILYDYAMGQAGMSAHFPNMANSDLLIGAPGVFNWKGSPILYRDGPEIPSVINKRSVNPASFTELIIPDMELSREIKSFGYFGYVVSSGYFFSRDKLWYVGGAPRASNYQGEISIFEFPAKDRGALKILQTRQGTRIGEYFGASLTVADINGDNLDDIIVGAPHYSSKVDEGRVYVYLGNKRDILLKPDQSHVIEGRVPKGQFGFAVQTLGDIDIDGYSDVAISAPYEDDNRGVIYIYSGSQKGLSLEPIQRIVASEISPNLRGFGISFSKATDIDGNKYNDLAVGSYMSENAVLFRARPIVKLAMVISSYVGNLDHSAKSFVINVCLWYAGSFLPSNLNVTRIITVDADQKRAYLSTGNTRSQQISQVVTLEEEKINCENITIEIKNNTKNFVDPIQIIVTQDLKEEKNTKTPIYIGKTVSTEDKFCKICPIVNHKLSIEETKIEVPYVLNCGSDKICDSDLRVQGTFVGLSSANKFVIGSKKTLQLEIEVRNLKEPAYLTQIDVRLPENVHLSNTPVFCEEETVNSTTLIICDVDNPLNNGTKKIIKLNLDMTGIKSIGKPLQFFIEARSKSDISGINNKQNLHLNLIIEADLSINGNTQKDSYYYGNQTLSNVSHIYEVQKSGASPINEVSLTINIPVAIKIKNSVHDFVKIYEPRGFQGGQPFSCQFEDPFFKDEIDVNKEEQIEGLLDDQSNTNETERTKRSLDKNVSGNNVADFLPTNRTTFLNCSMPDVICKKAHCIIGPFTRSLNVARLQIKLVINMTVLSTHVLGKKDIVYLSTDGSVKEIDGKRQDSVRVSSTLIVEPPIQQVDSWIIILAVIVGVLILLLIILGLIKAGFFKRKQKEELEALKQADVAQEFEHVKEPSTECTSETEES